MQVWKCPTRFRVMLKAGASRIAKKVANEMYSRFFKITSHDYNHRPAFGAAAIRMGYSNQFRLDDMTKVFNWVYDNHSALAKLLAPNSDI